MRCFPGVASVVLLAAQLLLSSAADARPLSHGIDDFTIRTWNEQNGLASSRISAIEQDQDGYLWLGTDAGVVRFDGIRFVPLTAVGDVVMPMTTVTAILSTQDRSLWISYQGRSGLLRVQNGKVTSYGPQDGLPDGYVPTLYEDRAGHVWLGHTGGLFRFDGTRWNTDTDPSLKGDPVLAVYESRDGKFWVATPKAVLRRERAGAALVQVDTVSVSSVAFQGFSEAPDGTMWIGDFRQGFRQVGHPAPRVPEHRGWGVQLLHDHRGNFWVATRNQGLWRVTIDRNGRSSVDVLTPGHGLVADSVQCVFEDREGNIWLGTQAGLQQLAPNRVTPIASLPLARAVAMTPDGSVWIGSATGLTRFSENGQRRDYTEVDGVGGSVVLALHVDTRGVLWISTESGVSRYQNGRFTGVTIRSDNAIQRVFSIASTSSSVWLRDTARRLFRVVAADSVATPKDVPADFETMVLSGDSHDNVWIGSRAGRAGVLHPNGTFETHQFDIGTISTIYESADGSMWIGGDEGLAHFVNGRTHTLRLSHGLPTHVRAIVEDEDRVLWVGLQTGIARIEPLEIERAASQPDYRVQYRMFNTADGAAGVPMNEGSLTALRARDGRLWFATSAGVTVVDPHHTGAARSTPPVILETVTADGKPFSPQPGVMLPPKVTNVQFAFTALALTDSARVRFKYRLEGLDRDWVDADTTRQASYANLGPGEYRFAVMASNGDGAWGTPTALDFSVTPTFYETRWFDALCVLTGLLLLAIFWRMNARRVRHQFALVLAERIRMSRAIHDTLLQGLAGLALQLDDLAHGPEVEHAATGERLRRIRRRVEEYIREARQSIWDLRSPVLEQRAFPDAIREVGSRAIADREVALDVRIKGAPQPCSPVIEQQLLLICQEALTNAVRHGAPQRVDVELEYGGEELRVLVRDDGRGFDPGSLERVSGHYGVISMRERAAQVRGRLTIASAPGKGTSVETIIPVH
jgi:signal transduction histidine kinase/ligand-binding sensor domain-containing protein